MTYGGPSSSQFQPNKQFSSRYGDGFSGGNVPGGNVPAGRVPSGAVNRGSSANYTRGGRLKTGATVAVGYVVAIWAVQIVNFFIFGGQLSYFGIHPLDLNGLWGIVTAPFLHANWQHLMSNTIPGAIFCFLIGLSGRKAWWEVTIIVMLVAGVGTWLLGGPGSNHIGSSGMVYGWLAYLIVRGLFNRSFIQFILGVVLGVIYSGFIWGVLPIYEGVSWQAHLFGAIGGVLAGMAITSDDPVRQITHRPR